MCKKNLLILSNAANVIQYGDVIESTTNQFELIENILFFTFFFALNRRKKNQSTLRSGG